MCFVNPIYNAGRSNENNFDFENFEQADYEEELPLINAHSEKASEENTQKKI